MSGIVLKGMFYAAHPLSFNLVVLFICFSNKGEIDNILPKRKIFLFNIFSKNSEKNKCCRSKLNSFQIVFMHVYTVKP